MTTSPSDAFVLGLALAAAAGPLAAQEVRLPSGHAATLYDVVLEAAGGATAPDAGTDPEALPEGELDESVPLDQPAPAGTAAGGADAATGGVARFRLTLPGLGGEGAAYADVAADLPWLCENLALPALAANGWAPTEVVVSLSDREVPFGQVDAEAVQFFEGFRIEDGACVPQAF